MKNFEILMEFTLMEPGTPENVVVAFFVFLSSLASIFGNVIVVLSYFTSQNLRSEPGNCFVTNLALTDLLCAICVQVPCGVNLSKPDWYFKGTACHLHSLFTWMVLSCSNWSLAAISVDRAIAFHKPFRYPSLVTLSRVRFVLALIWIFCLIFPTLVINKAVVWYQRWELMCTPSWTKEFILKRIIASATCFWVPIVTVLVCNFSIICAVRNLRQVVFRDNSEETGDVDTQFRLKGSTKALRSLYVLVAVYFTCVFPYFAAKLTFIAHERGILPHSLFLLFTLMMFFASAVNPFIYCLLRSDHKQAFMETLNIVKCKLGNVFSICFKSNDNSVN